ncbi:putative small lipoprotein YifL [Bartonella fuyuanensis]|uniref:Putative small lipoprotein YifL n=1 Tax=Bartonella fuyuanensis TaxID=1460968 RepID=A0A840DRU6_9HYPH|nr:lipoprotein [Bartonella fuyuanensis]MBB4075831.1 putative small lipoprotein YifL [Bartonella fuyuanensis]
MKIIVKGLMIILLGGLGVVGCGRKGSLEIPLTSVEKPMQRTSVAKNEDDKPFILDRLIK